MCVCEDIFLVDIGMFPLCESILGIEQRTINHKVPPTAPSVFLSWKLLHWKCVWKLSVNLFSMYNIWNAYYHWKLPIINTTYITSVLNRCVTYVTFIPKECNTNWKWKEKAIRLLCEECKEHIQMLLVLFNLFHFVFHAPVSTDNTWPTQN